MSFRNIGELMAAETRRMLAERRPTMEMVVRVMRMVAEGMRLAGADVSLELDGPDAWIWVDRTIPGDLIRRFVVSASADEELPGYPMLTISQCLAPRLDSWVTFSQLVFGNTDEAIKSVIDVCFVNHTGAFAGLRNAMVATIENGLDIEAGMESIRESLRDTKTAEELLPKKKEDLN